jgi:hypothetical protein
MNQVIEDNDARRARIDEIVIPDSVIDAEESSEADNVIYYVLITQAEKISALCSFPLATL